ncbi:MAG: surface-adhesin E family protein [Nitrospiria bacterium]
MKIKRWVIVFLLALMLPNLAAAAEKEWVLFVKDKLFDHYYDRASMNWLPEGIIQVIVKVEPRGKEGYDLLMGVRKQKGFLMGGYEDYAYTLKAIEIDCPEKTRNILDQSDYGKAGNLLDSVRAMRRKWTPIAAESIDDFYHKALCKKKDK